uniref:C-type lectin domain-containing protein n=1 Tax=Xiphophorus maculatus TaxID=8083 RepID=A0A3B5RCL8_XIPMA
MLFVKLHSKYQQQYFSYLIHFLVRQKRNGCTFLAILFYHVIHIFINVIVCLCSYLSEDETCLKCAAGWEKRAGSCYYFNTNKSSWTDSRRSCIDHGSDLVKIDNKLIISRFICLYDFVLDYLSGSM